MELQPRHIRAPELSGTDWLNDEPILVRDHPGQVILLDFWDCANLACLRALDYVRDWDRKYRDFGMLVVGVHVPEYQFARVRETVERALRLRHIVYPVVLDNEAIIRNAYAVFALPARCLIDRDGFLRFVQHGEGGYLEFERALQQLLSEAGYRGELPSLTEPKRPEDMPGAVCYRPTNPLALGYVRSTVGNAEGVAPESTVNYADPGLYLPERIYLAGKWNSEREFARCDGGENELSSLLLRFAAREVVAVMRSRSGLPVRIEVEQDGEPLTKLSAGSDVTVGNPSVVEVDAPGVYRLVRNREFGEHLLRLVTTGADLEVYSFAFTPQVIPDVPISE